jgi:RNAse (barnase) inhibitor barstar
MTWDILKQRHIEKLEMEYQQLKDNLNESKTTEYEDIINELEEIEFELNELKGE